MEPSLRADAGAPPQNLEAEASLLGALLIDSEAIVKIADQIKPSDFFDKRHEHIYEAISNLYEHHKAVDVLTLSDQLKNNGYLDSIGGPAYLTELTNFVPTAAHVEQYAEIVSQKALRRRLITASKEITGLSYDESKQLTELIEEAETKLFNVSQEHVGQDIVSLESLLAESFDRLDDLHKDKHKVRGVSTGFNDLDNVLAGFQRSDLIVLAARPSMGKAQPLDSNILTSTGWKSMKDIEIGDELASVDGKRSTVIGVFPQGVKQIYRITFSDGRSAEATGEHLWTVHYRDWDNPRVLTTEKIIDMLSKKRYQNRLWIDTFTGKFGAKKDLPIAPWALGILISEGDLNSLRFSTASDLIYNRMLTDLGKDFTLTRASQYDYRIRQALSHKRAGFQGVSPNQIKETLKEIGLWGKHSYDKFIPEIYKDADYQTRLELLQGILDGNGWVEKFGTARISTDSQQLAEDIADIARSLGGWASIKNRKTFSSYKGVRKEGLPSYVISIVHPEPSTLFTLPEKKIRAVAKRRYRKPVITAITKTRRAQAQCIMVSHPSNLYITDNYVVTHNTALALNFAHNVALKANEPVLVFSLEMSKEQLVDRLLSMESGVDAWALRTGNLTDSDFEKIGHAMGTLSEAPIYIDDTPGITVSDMRTKARREAHLHKLGLIIVDYLQLMSGGSRFGGDGNRVQEISEISRGLKGLARELNVPVIALSQLSRSVENRSPQVPQLADLRDSGSIEQDADVVMFIYREDYYHPDTERKGIADVMIKKHRNGPIDNVEMSFNKEKQRFISVDTRHKDPFSS